MAQDFRGFLQGELRERCSRNSSYSLRSFARFLGISHTSLSCILRGQRPVSQKTKLKVASALGLAPDQLEMFQETDLPETQNFEKISVEQYHLMADWYHDAILELLHNKDFHEDYNWIASRLEISPYQARDAMERLILLGQVERTDAGLRPTFQLTTTVHQPLSTAARRKNQKQLLEKALLAVDEVSFEERDNSSVVMAISKTDLPVAKEMIKQFRRELLKKLQSPQKESDSVYQLAVAFFPLTHEKGDC